MKRIYIIFIMFISLGVMSFSCNNENGDPTPINLINEFVGNWTFESLEYNGITWIDCDMTTTGADSYPLLGWNRLDLVVNASGVVDMNNSCKTTSFDFDGNVPNENRLELIHKGDVFYSFEIIDYDVTSTNKFFIVKMLTAPNTSSPIGGTFTLIQ